MLLIFPLLISSSFIMAYAQQPQLASYRETAHVLVDEKVQNQTTAFITLASTSPVEIKVPTDLNEKIHATSNLTSIVVTNADKCILGVQDQGCVLINIVSPTLVGSYNITTIQTVSRSIGDSLIDNINKAFAINAQFNSVYVTPNGGLGSALGTSGVITGNKTISVVYTMSRPDSSYLFDGLTAILIPKQIRDDGGFFDAAKKMAQDSNSTVTFAITPGQGDTLLSQLQVAKHYPITSKITSIKPLELLGIDKLERSSYFSVGFFPLNSILDVTVISNDNIAVTNHGDLAPTTIKNGQKFPTDLTKPGWIIDPESGKQISAVYLFGTTTSVTDDQSALTLGPYNGQPIENNTKAPTPTNSDNYSIYALIGIVAVGAAAIYLFMKRR